MPAPASMGAGTASQLIRGVGRTWKRGARAGGQMEFATSRAVTLLTAGVAVVLSVAGCRSERNCPIVLVESVEAPGGKYTARVEEEHCQGRDKVRLWVGVTMRDGTTGGVTGGPILVGDVPVASGTRQTGAHVGSVEWQGPELLVVRHDPAIRPSLWLEAKGTLTIRYVATRGEAK